MNNIEQKFTSAGWSVQYRRDRVCVVRGGETLLVCYKYAGGGDYTAELNTAYETMVSKGYIEAQKEMKISYSDDPSLKQLQYLNQCMKLVEDTVVDCMTRGNK